MRIPSALDRVTDDFVASLIGLVPEVAIGMGAPFADRTISDFSPEGAAELAQL